MKNIIRNKARKINSEEIVFGNLICYGSDEMEIYDLNTDIEPNKVDPETVEIVIGQYNVKNLDEPHLLCTGDVFRLDNEVYSTIVWSGFHFVIQIYDFPTFYNEGSGEYLGKHIDLVEVYIFDENMEEIVKDFNILGWVHDEKLMEDLRRTKAFE